MSHALNSERFQDVQRIGAGNHATVFGAWDCELERRVAIKVPTQDTLLDIFGGERLTELGIADGLQQLLDELGTAAGHRYTLLREAKLLARIDHPHVVPILEVGLLDDGPAVIMPLLTGGSLAERIGDNDSERNEDWREVLRVAIEIGTGLEALHRAGILHRDFKPNNVLFDGHGRPQIADLGLACHLDDEAAMADWPGTQAYMAPETLAHSFRDVRDDLYAYCIVIFQMFYGHMPFASRAARVGGRVSKIERPGGIPSTIHTILARGLAPAAAQRWPDLTTLLAELQQVEAELETPARRWPWFASGAAAAGLLGALVSSSVVHADACAEVETELARVWNPQIESEMSGALGSHRSAAALGSWAGRYSSVRGQECELAKTRDESLAPSPCMLAMQQTFLTTVDTLRNQGMRAGLDHSAVIRELPRPERCLDQPRDLGVADTGLSQLRQLDTEIATLVRLGDFDPAHARVRTLQADARTHNTSYFLARVSYWEGRLARLEGRLDAAKSALESAYTQAGTLDDRVLIAEVALELTAIAAALEDPKSADVYARTAAPVFAHQQPARTAELLEHQALALLTGDTNQQRGAVTLLREALTTRETDAKQFGGSIENVAVTLAYLARALLEVDQTDEALRQAQRGLGIRTGHELRTGASMRELLHLTITAQLRLGQAEAASATIDTMLAPLIESQDHEQLSVEIEWLGSIYAKEFAAIDPRAIEAIIDRMEPSPPGGRASDLPLEFD